MRAAPRAVVHVVADLEATQRMTRNRKARKAAARKSAHRMHGGKHSAHHDPTVKHTRGKSGTGHKSITASKPSEAAAQEIRRAEG